MQKQRLIPSTIILLAFGFAISQSVSGQQNSDLYGDYLGQIPPGDTAVVFAPGIISTKHHEHSSPSFSPDGNEIFWSLWERPKSNKPQVVMHIKKKNGIWGTPAVASFSGEVMDGSPIISGDGDKLFIYRKVAERDIEIIYFTKSNNKWSNPKSIVKGFSPTVAKNGNVYFNSDDWIYKVEFRNGKYIEPRQLNKEINLNGYLNWTPFVAPDESYLIFSRCDRNGDYGNLYICFWSDTENNWTEPVEIGELINTPAQERFPSVSPDGKYLFFTRSRGNHDDIYWVSAKVIQDLKEKHKKK